MIRYIARLKREEAERAADPLGRTNAEREQEPREGVPRQPA